MLREYTDITYYRADSLVLELSKNTNIPIWIGYDKFKDYKKMAELLLNPFLKELMTKRHCYSIVLKENCEDGLYRETIYCTEKESCIQIKVESDTSEYSEWENKSMIPLSKGVYLSELVKVLKNNQYIQDFTDLNQLSTNIIKEIDRFCWEVYVKEYQKYIKKVYYSNFKMDLLSLEKIIKERLMGNYEEYPILSVLVIYNYLMESNNLSVLLRNKLNEIILSQEFLNNCTINENK